VKKKTKLHFDQLQLKLHQIIQQKTISEKMDFYISFPSQKHFMANM